MADAPLPGPAPRPLEVERVLDATKRQNVDEFNAEAQKINDEKILPLLKGYLQVERDNVQKLSMNQRLQMRKIMGDRLKAIQEQRTATGKDLLKLDAEHREAINLNILKDIGSAIAKPAHWVAEKASGMMEVLEKNKTIGPYVAMVRSFFGDTVPEMAKTIGSWLEKAFFNVLASPASFGMEDMPLIGFVSKWAKSHKERLEARDAIREAIDAEQEHPTQGIVTFNEKDFSREWRSLAIPKLRSTAASAPAGQPTPTIDWAARVHEAARIKREEKDATGKQLNGTDDAHAIKLTLADLLKDDKTREKEKKQEEEKLAQKKLEAAKKSWFGDGTKDVMKIEGTTTKMTKSADGSWTLSLPNATALDEAGGLVSAEAKQLKIAWDALKDKATEIEVGGTDWEMKKTPSGSAVRFAAAFNMALLPQMKDVLEKFSAQTRAQTLRIDRTGVLPVVDPLIALRTESSAATLVLNPNVQLAQVPLFFTTKAAELNAATKGTEMWKWDGTKWQNA